MSGTSRIRLIRFVPAGSVNVRTVIPSGPKPRRASATHPVIDVVDLVEIISVAMPTLPWRTGI
jgi:hypothetical protein